MAWLSSINQSKENMAVEPLDLDRHESVRLADPYSSAVAYRRLAWIARLEAGIIIILGACLIISLSAWSALLPLKTTEIALVRADPSDDRLYRIEPARALTVQGFDLLMESMARRYVRLLLEIDSITQTERFREAFRMTDDKFYRRFQKERIESGEVQKAINSGLTRSITVESIDFIENTHGTYKYAVDIVQTDMRKQELVEKKKLRVYLNMTTRPQSATGTDRFENPLGVTVLDLILKPRGNS